MAEGKRHDFQKKSCLLHACLLSFNSGKLKPFIWDFEDVFRLPCKLCLLQSTHAICRLVLPRELLGILACCVEMNAHRSSNNSSNFFFSPEQSCFFPFSCQQIWALTSPSLPFFSSPLPSWLLFLSKVLVSKNTGVSKWPLQLQWH